MTNICIKHILLAYQFLHGLQSVLWVFYSVGINEIIVFICRQIRHMTYIQ